MTKKVGILTFHGAHNYGSVLQSYASVLTLRQLGYNPEIINLRNQAQIDAYKVFNTKSLAHRLFKLLISPSLISRQKKFEYFINYVLPVSPKEYRTGNEIDVDALDYDIYYTGSDQVWNPACQDFESAYYLDFVHHKHPTIAYAPSLGKGNFNDTDKELIKGLLDNVDFLSCREQTGADLISELSGRKATQVCDPVLLQTAEQWSRVAKSPKRKKEYILAYFLNNNHGNRSQLYGLQKSTGYDVILLNDYIRDFFNPGITLKLDASPEEFIGLIQDAKIVYTNSFHATAFSVIFKKNFYTAISATLDVHNNNDSRKIDFLSSLGLENRLVRDGETINPFNDDIDYEKVGANLNVIRTNSLSYLKDALNGK
ncbi:MAG: polysaccharide pyruvyl transferase family protein [Muribaculaceae bacterium]|nr:polysaccharide pyruvyl transferase family protein [Muribaculaceae bacterium]